MENVIKVVRNPAGFPLSLRPTTDGNNVLPLVGLTIYNAAQLHLAYDIMSVELAKVGRKIEEFPWPVELAPVVTTTEQIAEAVFDYIKHMETVAELNVPASEWLAEVVRRPESIKFEGRFGAAFLNKERLARFLHEKLNHPPVV